MRWKGVASSWLERDGRRLDCGPYMSGSLEARVRLETMRAPKARLQDLTLGGIAGLVNAGRFRRTWVEDPGFGVPFLSSTEILNADLSRVSLIARSAVAESPQLTIREGWTLISRSGTIGRMALARPDMDGMACSEHVLRVVPDASRVPPGYLFAYLSSKFGLPLVIGGTYGAIIQHIEPSHISDLPVPRLGDEFEAEVGALVERAAALRCEASANLSKGIAAIQQAAGLPDLRLETSPTPHSVTSVSSASVQGRFDAFFHSHYHAEARNALLSAKTRTETVAALSDEIFEPARFKRVQVEDPGFGIPFFGTAALMWAEPTMSYLLARSTKNLGSYIVDRNTLLVPRSGQLSGIIGTAVLPYGDLIGGAVSEDAIRIRCKDADDAGYLLVALASAYGIRQLKARAYGSSIPHLDVTQIGEVLVPDLSGSIRAEVAQLGASTATLRTEAVELERKARALVEEAIVEAA